MQAAAATCQPKRTNHQVTIRGGAATPEHTSAIRCDTLIITNGDNRIRLIAFGPHRHHEAYDGVTEKSLGPSQSLMLVLNQTGSFAFHDHIDDTAAGTFTVAAR